MQLMNENVTAMPLPIPMSMGVLMQGKKFKSTFGAAITSLGEAGVLGFRPPKLLPPLLRSIFSPSPRYATFRSVCPRRPARSSSKVASQTSIKTQLRPFVVSGVNDYAQLTLGLKIFAVDLPVYKVSKDLVLSDVAHQ